MIKPVDEEEMLLRIAALLRRAKIANEHKLIMGDTVLDYDAMTLITNGERQELPQKEFMLIPRAGEPSKTIFQNGQIHLIL